VADYIVRPVAPDEWRKLRELRLEGLRDSPNAFGATFDESLSFGDEYWRAMAQDQNYFVAVVDERFVGLLSGAPHREEAGHWLFGMYVTPEWRGSGVAASLVRAVRLWARELGATSVKLHVTNSETRARAFYVKMGFRDTGATITMHRDPSIVLSTMECPLSSELVVERVDPRRLHEVRRRVLRFNDPSIRVADPRDDDDTALHFAGILDGDVVASASFYPSQSPVNPEVPTFQLRYMTVEPSLQGRGYGRQLLERAEFDLLALRVRQIWANGRDTARAFYRATGWLLVPGSEHLSPETQLPHTIIYKNLSPEE
jgi:GNAT superfamily N-acetyltransferase